MTAPVALQILTSMKIIMGEDGTNEGMQLECVCVMYMYALYVRVNELCVFDFNISIF